MKIYVKSSDDNTIKVEAQDVRKGDLIPNRYGDPLPVTQVLTRNKSSGLETKIIWGKGFYSDGDCNRYIEIIRN